MTNTRITDPEILEQRFPVLLKQFNLRENTGGKGKHTGGNGVKREMMFLVDMKVSILSERRVFHPRGLLGGEDGERGCNLYIRKNGEKVNLGGKNHVDMAAGDSILILTPGGGGFGTGTRDHPTVEKANEETSEKLVAGSYDLYQSTQTSS
jgi:5-oxoprolinase (ATP-hydrolysing)